MKEFKVKPKGDIAEYSYGNGGGINVYIEDVLDMIYGMSSKDALDTHISIEVENPKDATTAFWAGRLYEAGDIAGAIVDISSKGRSVWGR
jgi:hypothetical protein